MTNPSNEKLNKIVEKQRQEDEEAYARYKAKPDSNEFNDMQKQRFELRRLRESIRDGYGSSPF